MKQGYFFYDSNSNRVCGIGTIDDANWDVHQAALQNSHPGCNLIMVQADDATLSMLRQGGPQNFVVTPSPKNASAGTAPALSQLPPSQCNLTPIIVDNNDSNLEAMNAKMDSMLTVLGQIATYLQELVPAPPPKV